MAFMDKLKFWKKKDEFADLDKELGSAQGTGGRDTLGLPSSGYDDHLSSSAETGMDHEMPAFGLTPPREENPFARQSFQEVPQQSAVQSASNLNIQLDLVSAKLETMKVSLESINHRLLAMEHALHVRDYTQQQPQRRRGVW